MAKGKIGFIGLGSMGKPMAKRLLEQGWAVTGCAHVRRDAIDELKKLGLVEAGSPRQVAEAADYVITMVRDTNESRDVILGDAGALSGMRRGTTLIIMSTIDPDFCRRVAEDATPRGIAVLDAPVSGFPFRAEQGALAIMVGGEPSVIERCRPVLEAMGQIFPCGTVGMGMVTKLANNAVAMGTAALLLEARALARAYGMSEENLFAVFKHSSANSFLVQNWEAIGKMWDHVLGLGLKDLGICLGVAKARGVRMPLAASAGDFQWSAYR